MRPDFEMIDSTAEGLPEAVQDRLARILDDYLVGVEQGAPITPDELLAQHPEDAEHLRGYLSGLQLFHAAAVAPKSLQSPSLIGGKLQVAQVIGDFRLLREIGRGGMGVVYEAEQLSLRRRVALKFLPFTATHDPRQIGRFKNEAQAAAQVQHPNIVPVYAVGEQHGVNYYVMQLIGGQSLAATLAETRPSSVGSTAAKLAGKGPSGKYLSRTSGSAPRPTGPCDTTQRAGQTAHHVRAIAGLGIQAAEALHAAHLYGIVHRDVKPSNLIVDDQGKLWVTDFGLARCRETAGLTQTGDILGTMRYMSPEQALGRAELVDCRTDIYSLGVTLYELATLHHPTGATSDAGLLVDRSRFVSKPLRHWNRQIPVDFQTIVLKAIAEFPHERYATAQELADDLARFLEGKPVLASPPNLLSRTAKWAGRHRGLVAAAAAILLVAFAGMFATTFFMVRGQVATDRALVVARENLRQAHVAFDRFGTELVDQLAAIPGAEGVRYQLLQDSLGLLQDFERQAANDPKLTSELAMAYSKMGTLTEKLGDRQLALDRHLAAQNLWEARAAAEPANRDVARNLALAHNNIGLLLADLGRQAEALQSLEKAQQLQQSLLTADKKSEIVAANLAATISNLGLVLKQGGRRDEAARKFREAIEIQERLVAASPQSEAVLRGLAASYNNLGSLDESPARDVAVDAYRKAIEIQRRLVKSNTVNRIYQGDLARTYNNLGFVFAHRQDWSRAVVSYTDAIQLQELMVKASPLAASYRRDLAISYNNLGMVQSRAGRLAQAGMAFQQSLDIQKLLAAAEPKDAKTLSNLGGIYNNLGLLRDRQKRPDDAENNLRQAVNFQRQAFQAAPEVSHYRELLTNHYANYLKFLRDHAKPLMADDVVRERDALLAGGPQIVNTAAGN